MSRRNFRRFRQGVPLIRGSRRPTDKELIFVSQTVTTSNVVTSMKTATFPCTLVGLRWNMVCNGIITTASSTISWIIVLVHDGNTANTISQSNGADMYTPENDVMAFGTIQVQDADLSAGGPVAVHFEGNTKTMRKMRQGDILQFVTLGENANCATLRGTVQFFCKT